VLRAGLWWLGARLDAPSHAWLVGVPNGSVLGSLAPDAPVLVAGRELPLRDLVARDAFDGSHAPIGVFAAAGGPIRPQPGRVDVSVLDVAPLLFALAGQPVPDDLEHPLRTDLLDPAWLAAHPPATVGASALPGLPRPAAIGGVSDDAMTERLRALGYVK
jgi:hypothetical protein